jgi:hypothetical protein
MDTDDKKPEDAAWDAVWPQIRERLPKSLRDNPKTEQRIAFLLGLGAGKLTGRILRKLLGGGGL